MDPMLRLSILDEEVLFRDCLVRLLEANGFIVGGQFGEAHAFLTSISQERPRVALLEIALQSADGLTVLEEAHQLSPETRLLVVTRGMDTDFLDRTFRAGAAGYLDKATTRLQAVVDAIHAVIRGENVFPMHAVESLLRSPGKRSESAELLRVLSDRERQVLAHLSVGADNLQIATLLRISERTVKAHVSNLYRKLGQDNRTQLALLARQSGVRPPSQNPPPVPKQA
jgi:two-component system nitrate/nitrite response regulator NarL